MNGYDQNNGHARAHTHTHTPTPTHLQPVHLGREGINIGPRLAHGHANGLKLLNHVLWQK